ncbi:MAG: hypothetical protein GY953_45110 [bacterium]|nr:hypothetical protein [bacterium]
MLSRLFLLLLAAGLPAVVAQQPSDDFRIERDHPRLLLNARRTRLLRREVERQSMRYMQFEALMTRKTEFPEQGFALALFHVASQDESYGRRAIEWALANDDLRQLALVFDWCQNLLTPEESSQLAGKLRTGSAKLGKNKDLPSVRARLLAAVTLAGHDDAFSEEQIRDIITNWWRGGVVQALRRGGSPIPRNHTYALLELLHATRDNTLVDLRVDYKPYFTSFAAYHLLTYYPAIYPAPANDYRIPVIEDASEPDLRDAALSRAAELSMVAYDPNALEPQFLQGWAMLDQFLMRGAFGVPYEFLWANPYQPGLSYYNAPLIHHDPASGQLILRSHWDGDALWFYYTTGVMQTFADGVIKPLNWDDLPPEMNFGKAMVLSLKERNSFSIAIERATTYYLIGLAANRAYDVEVDDEQLAEHTTDAGGILVMEFPAGRKAGVRLAPAGR